MKGFAMPSDHPPPSPPPPDIPEDDPVLQAEVKRALGPYEQMLSPEILKTMRETLIDALTTHPVGIRALAKLRKAHEAAQASHSGTREKDGAPGAPADKLADKKGSVS
jgi:hypothetical protein